MVTKQEKLHTFNGPAILVAMFRTLDPVTKRAFKAKLAGASPIFAKLVDQSDFMFGDIRYLDDASVQTLLGHFTEDEWLHAWKLADAAVRERIIKNMSERRHERFLKEFEGMGRVPKVKVYRIQQRISQYCLAAIESGKFRLHSRSRSSRPK